MNFWQPVKFNCNKNLTEYGDGYGIYCYYSKLCLTLTGGYYTIEQADHKLRIIALNTNLFSRPDKGDVQLNWLTEVLEKSQTLREKVVIACICSTARIVVFIYSCVNTVLQAVIII